MLYIVQHIIIEQLKLGVFDIQIAKQHELEIKSSKPRCI